MRAKIEGYDLRLSGQGELMTSEIDRFVDNDTCRRLSWLGYARSKHVRLYGQELQIVSDPFVHDEGGIAIEVVADSNPAKRTMRLPLSVVQVARKAPEKAIA
jgi:hypothetical protein